MVQRLHLQWFSACFLVGNVVDNLFGQFPATVTGKVRNSNKAITTSGNAETTLQLAVKAMNSSKCQQEICRQNGRGPKDLCRQIPQTVRSHKTTETEHGPAINIFEQPTRASWVRGPLHCRSVWAVVTPLEVYEGTVQVVI